MSTRSSTTLDPTWTDPTDCPFCGASLPDPGAGFVDHIRENEACEEGFDDWRENVTGDIRGGWSG
ncbi:DUF7501 family protein [Halopenitus persicus]|uniref:Uncharacterized protein n=1 Tax=Halopenitus persicus TaxID=1048396 RepID=A0A1H3HCD2_9EURY|nr:hypothetical protein [Halopenitus persicus]QHS16020.1 hypothetical protein GWK26_02000 [haloarchaeon 3A1-DGR]SDY13146.1 hypothetical protein SAMN05216564_103219 [Halopenitus persicus]